MWPIEGVVDGGIQAFMVALRERHIPSEGRPELFLN